MSGPFEWSVRVVVDLPELLASDEVLVAVYRPRSDGSVEVCGGEGVHRVLDAGMVPPSDAYIRLPRAALDGLRAEVVRVTSPTVADAERAALRDALAVERTRVDRTLDVLLHAGREAL